MSALLEPTVLEVRLLNTGDGLGEKLPLIKSHIPPAPPFRPKKKQLHHLKYSQDCDRDMKFGKIIPT